MQLGESAGVTVESIMFSERSVYACFSSTTSKPPKVFKRLRISSCFPGSCLEGGPKVAVFPASDIVYRHASLLSSSVASSLSRIIQTASGAEESAARRSSDFD